MESTGSEIMSDIPPFRFEPKWLTIDWRRMASLDVDRIVRDTNIRQIQDILPEITFCNIDAEIDSTAIDANYIKLFRLAQLCIEYLAYREELLTTQLQQRKAKASKLQQVLEEEHKLRLCDAEALKQLNIENKQKQRIIENLRLLVLKESEPSGTKCPYCSKVFIDLAYLQAHVVRRHPQETPPKASSLGDASQHILEEINRLRTLQLAQKAQENTYGDGCGERHVNKDQQSVDTLLDNSNQESGRMGDFSEQPMPSVIWRQLEQQRSELQQFVAKQELKIQHQINYIAREIKKLSKKNSQLERQLSSIQSNSSVGLAADQIEPPEIRQKSVLTGSVKQDCTFWMSTKSPDSSSVPSNEENSKTSPHETVLAEI